MTRTIFRTFLGPVALTLLLSLLVACSSSDDGGTTPDVVADATSGEVTGDAGGDATASGDRMSRLHAAGTQIVDADGNPVIWRGVNLGGWMFLETWVTLHDYSLHTRAHVLGISEGLQEDVDAVLREIGPLKIVAMMNAGEGADFQTQWLGDLEAGLAARTDATTAADFRASLEGYLPEVYDDSDLQLRLKLEERFGTEGRDELLDIFEGAWIQESDVAWLAEQGFNLVRVPLGYRALTTGTDTAKPTSLEWNEAAFGHIDQLLDWCDAHGMYALLDIQEAPGGQNDYSGEATLYTDPAMQDLTVELWEELSRRYHDRDVVAAYSLLAEPMSAPTAQARDEMYDRIFKAVRALGDDHLIVIHDGFIQPQMGSLPDPADYEWDNVVYSTHLFEWGARDVAFYESAIGFYETTFTGAQERHGVPYYMGSFSTIFDQPWAYEAAGKLVEWYESKGWAWSLWTYKRIDDPIESELWADSEWEVSTSWGLRGRLSGDLQRVDVFQDDFETLKTKMAAYADYDVAPNVDLLNALKDASPLGD